MSQSRAVDAVALTGPATFLERLQVIKDALILRECSSHPLVLMKSLNDLPSAFAIFISLFRPENKARTFSRAVYDITLRYIEHRGWNIRQWLFFLGARNSTEVYDAWARKNKMENLTDELEGEGEGGAKLHWVGPRSYERVLIYCHGKRLSIELSVVKRCRMK